MKNPPLIITGYHEGSPEARRFAHIWHERVRKIAPESKIMCVAVGGAVPPYPHREIIMLERNLGHVGDLLHGRKTQDYCGWSMAVLTGLLVAYQDERDAVWIEQDTLCFGPVIQQMEAEIRDFGFICGRSKIHPCAQSLFMVRHAWIPEFVRRYLSLGTDNDKNNLPESKFRTMMQQSSMGTFFSFGCDRDRSPSIPYDSPVFYCQRITAEEMAELNRRGLI